MASNHTPGPWEIHPWGDADIEIVANDTTVCNVPGFNDETTDPSATTANAKLIAAAPELLNALEVMVASFAGAMGLDENDLDADGESYDCVKQARAAIRSAKIWES